MWMLGRFVLVIIAIVCALELSTAARLWDTRTLVVVAVLGTTLSLYGQLDQLRRQRLQQDIDTTLDALRRGQPFQARGRPGWLLPALAGLGLLCVLAAVAMSTAHWLLAALLLVPLALAVVAAWPRLAPLLRPGPMLHMDRSGLRHALHAQPIAWREVLGIQLHARRTRRHNRHWLVLGIRSALPPAPHPPRRGRPARRQGAQATGIRTVSIPLDRLDATPELVRRCALALRERNDAPFVRHWHARMSSAEIDAALRMQALTDEIEEMAALMPAAPVTASAEPLPAYSPPPQGLFDPPPPGPAATQWPMPAPQRQRGERNARLWGLAWLVIVLALASLALHLCSHA